MASGSRWTGHGWGDDVGIERRMGGWALVGAPVVAVLGLALPGLAQDDPTPPARPAEIVAGTCAEPGDRVAELTEATFPVGQRVGEAGATVSETSFTRVDVSLDDLLAEAHAVVVRASADDPESAIACGEIGGVFDELGAVVIGLGEQGGSGYAGIAFLAPDEANAQTNVSLFVAPNAAAGGGPPPQPLPADIPTTVVVASDGTPVVVPVAQRPQPTPRPTSTPLPTATPLPTPTAGAIDVVLVDGGIEMPARLAAAPAVFTITNDGTEPLGFVMANELYVFSLDAPLAPGETGTLSVNLPPGVYGISAPVGEAGEAAGAEITVEVVVAE